ncbi:nucleoside deaminase [Halobacillus sp. MO56]
MVENFNELNHEYFMKEALKEAEKAGKRNDKPIGAVIVHNGEIIARGSNKITSSKDNIAHAEIDALHNNAGYLQKHARECLLYTSVEPCIMCVSALIMANIRNVVLP